MRQEEALLSLKLELGVLKAPWWDRNGATLMQDPPRIFSHVESALQRWRIKASSTAVSMHTALTVS